MDIVIPLYWHSHNNFTELRFALRSVERYLQGTKDVYIVGRHKPSWASDELIRIPKSDVFTPALNIRDKLYYASTKNHVSDEFLYMNDDHYLLEEFDIETFPYFYSGTLVERMYEKRNNPYSNNLEQTIKALMPKPTKNFDIHVPMRVEKKKMSGLIDAYVWSPPGFVIKSLYCNTYGIAGINVNDCVITRPVRDKKKLDGMLSGRSFFSTFDGAINDMIIGKLEELFPNKSRFEK